MEIIDNDRKNNGPIKPSTHNFYLGGALVLIGLVWILFNFDLIDDKVFDAIFSWQMLIVVIGGYLLAMKKWAAGGITLAVGLFFVTTGLLGLQIPVRKIVLPVACIAAGLAVIFSRKPNR